MIPHLLNLMPAASFDWETLLPVVFFVLYGIAQFLGQKKKGGPEAEEEPDVDMEERARKIREEIRRKIEARREAREGGAGPQPVPADRAPYDPTMPESMQGRPTVQPPVVEPVRIPEPPKPVTFPSMEEGLARQASLERSLHEQREMLVRARKEKKEARERALEMERQAKLGRRGSRKPRPSAPARSLRSSLLEELREPTSVRKAILLREILDTPPGLK